MHSGDVEPAGDASAGALHSGGGGGGGVAKGKARGPTVDLMGPTAHVDMNLGARHGVLKEQVRVRVRVSVRVSVCRYESWLHAQVCVCV